MIVELSKGYQITIPAEIRKRLDLKPGSRFELTAEKKHITIEALSENMEEFWKHLDNELKDTPQHHITPEELNDFSEFY